MTVVCIVTSTQLLAESCFYRVTAHDVDSTTEPTSCMIVENRARPAYSRVHVGSQHRNAVLVHVQ